MATYRVVMKGVYAIGQHLVKAFPFDSKGITVKPQNMIGINFSYCGLDSTIKCRKAHMFRIARFVDGIIPSYPAIAFVPCSNLLPEPYRSVLEVLMVPKCCIRRCVVRVPVAVLAAWSRMEIQYRIQPIFGALSWSIKASGQGFSEIFACSQDQQLGPGV